MTLPSVADVCADGTVPRDAPGGNVCAERSRPSFATEKREGGVRTSGGRSVSLMTLPPERTKALSMAFSTSRTFRQNLPAETAHAQKEGLVIGGIGDVEIVDPCAAIPSP